METQQWFHPNFDRVDIDDCYSIGGDCYIEPLSEKILDYQGRQFIAFERFFEQGGCEGYKETIVPGFVVGEIRGHEGKFGNSTFVELMTEEEQAGVEALVGEAGLSTNILFWSPSPPAYEPSKKRIGILTRIASSINNLYFNPAKSKPPSQRKK